MYRREVEKLKTGYKADYKERIKKIKLLAKIILLIVFIVGMSLFVYYGYISIDNPPKAGKGTISLAPWYAQVFMWGAVAIILGAIIYIAVFYITPWDLDDPDDFVLSSYYTRKRHED